MLVLGMKGADAWKACVDDAKSARTVIAVNMLMMDDGYSLVVEYSCPLDVVGFVVSKKILSLGRFCCYYSSSFAWMVTRAMIQPRGAGARWRRLVVLWERLSLPSSSICMATTLFNFGVADNTFVDVRRYLESWIQLNHEEVVICRPKNSLSRCLVFC